jgi:hypothetical protein
MKVKHAGDFDMDERIVLTWILNKQCVDIAAG